MRTRRKNCFILVNVLLYIYFHRLRLWARPPDPMCAGAIFIDDMRPIFFLLSIWNFNYRSKLPWIVFFLLLASRLPVPSYSSRLPTVTARSVAPDRVLACSFSVAIYPFCIWRAYIVQLGLCHHHRLRLCLHHRHRRRRREDCATASRLNLLFSFCLIVVPFVSVHRSSLRSFVIRDSFFSSASAQHAVAATIFNVCGNGSRVSRLVELCASRAFISHMNVCISRARNGFVKLMKTRH